MADKAKNTQPTTQGDLERRLAEAESGGGRIDHLTLPSTVTGEIPSDEINQRAQEQRNAQLDTLAKAEDTPSGVENLSVAELRSLYHTGVNPQEGVTPTSQAERAVTTQIVLSNDVSELPEGVSGRIISPGVIEVQIPDATHAGQEQIEALRESARRQIEADNRATRSIRPESRDEGTPPVVTMEELNKNTTTENVA